MNQTLTISVATICCKLIFRDPELFRRLAPLFRDYASNTPPDFHIYLDGRLADLSRLKIHGDPVLLEPGPDRLFALVYKYMVSGSIEIGRLHPVTGNARIILNQSYNLSTLFTAIRTCFQYATEQRSGIFIHGAAGIVGYDAYLFTGPSGAGKSTALKSLAPDRVIADDECVLRIVDTIPRVFSTPFRKESPSSGTLKAIFFPIQSACSFRLQDTTRGSGVAGLMANAMLSSLETESQAGAAIQTLDRLCRILPVYSLYFGVSSPVRKMVAA